VRCDETDEMVRHVVEVLWDLGLTGLREVRVGVGEEI
jgi:hypothetical protein